MRLGRGGLALQRLDYGGVMAAFELVEQVDQPQMPRHRLPGGRIVGDRVGERGRDDDPAPDELRGRRRPVVTAIGGWRSPNSPTPVRTANGNAPGSSCKRALASAPW